MPSPSPWISTRRACAVLRLLAAALLGWAAQAPAWALAFDAAGRLLA